MPESPGKNRLGVVVRLVARRAVFFIFLMVVMTRTLNWLGEKSRQHPEPAGLGRGMLDGALMPLAMPALLTGHDVPIYTANNTGRTYKLGYTLGVNVCGAFFFGITYFRVRQLRKSQ